MKRFILVVLVALVMGACTEVKFKSPQPPGAPNLEAFPSELIGEYNFVMMTDETQLKITENGIDGDDKKAFLSDSMVIRKMGDKYVLNIKPTKKTAAPDSWQVFILEPKGCGFVKSTVLVANDQKKIEDIQSRYGAELVQEGEQRALVIDSNVALKELLDEGTGLSVILEPVGK